MDLELRPEGETGPLANSVDAALSYYESFGAEWERQALIRLRPVAGPAAAADALVHGLAPFVWRRSISPASLRAVREMKERIERERRDAGRDVEYDLKEGPGGIRDVEFLTQALQLFTGGREPAVRSGNVLEALEALAAAEALSGETAAALASAYLWLRRAEHAAQLDEERQTHAFPREAGAQRALARRMGYADDDAEAARARLLDDWTAVRSEVRSHFDELLPAEPPVTRAARRPCPRALAGSVFAERAAAVAALLEDGPDAAASLAAMPDPLFAGLARAAAASPEQTRFAVRRRGLLARAAALARRLARAARRRARRRAGRGRRRGRPTSRRSSTSIRLLRREEMLLAACLDFAGVCDFEEVSRLLSSLAEAIVRRALARRSALAPRARRRSSASSRWESSAGASSPITRTST